MRRRMTMDAPRKTYRPWNPDCYRQQAISYGYMKKEEERLKAEIAELLKQAQQTDEAEDAVLGSRRGDELPDELAFREQRLAKILEAKQRLEEQAKVAAQAERQR